MFRLTLRTLRFRKGGFAATFIALFFGAALVMACGGLLETGVRTSVPPQRLAAAEVVITGNQTYVMPKNSPDNAEEDTESVTMPETVRLDAGLVDRVAGVPGVAKAIADVSVPVAVLKDGQPAGTGLLGHAWASAELAPYRLSAGVPPAGPGQIVLDQAVATRHGVKVGDQLDILVRATTEHVTVSGIAPANGSSVFLAQEDTTRLAGHPSTVDFIGVLATPGTDVTQLRQRIGDALRGQPTTILTGNERGLAEFPDALAGTENVVVLAAVIGGFSIMVSMFVVASTLGLSIQHRGRELALLRAIGTTPRQLRRMVLGEALVVAVLATALACAPGVFLGKWLFDRLAGFGVVPPEVVFHQGWIPMVVGIGAGLLTAIAAGYAAARRAGQTRPTEVLTEAAIQRRWLGPVRLIGAVLCFGGGTALAIVTVTAFDGPVAASTAGPTVMVWSIGLALVSPGLTKVLTAVLRWPLRAVTGMAGHLAMLNARASSVRLAAAVTPIMLVTGIATANIYLQTTQADAEQEAYTKNLRADVVLTSTTGGGLADNLIDEVRAVPGVAGASEFVASTGIVERPYDPAQEGEGWPLQGVSADGAAATTAVELAGGTLEDLRDNTVALPAEHARTLGRGIGDSITMRLGDGAQVDLRVVALFTGIPGYERFLVPADLLAAHTTTGLPSQILVRAAPGVATGTLIAALSELTAGHPGVAVADRDALTAAYADEQEMQASVNYILVGMIMAYTAISVVNTLVMATGRRRREFGLQRLTGSSRGQVLRMMTVEGVLVAAVGVVLGTVVSTTTLVPFSLVVTGAPMPSGPLWIYLSVVGVVSTLALVATLLPTWFALRARPAEAAVSPD